MDRKRYVPAKSLLYSTAVTLVTLAAATALLFTPGSAMALVSQEPQHAQLNSGARQPASGPETKAVVVTGTIIKSGSDFVLKDPSGTVYGLDAPEKVAPFEGKSVKVTGHLDAANATLLHVEAIEAISA
jgi:hypothetical protein